jgi:hypothetical protein
VWNDFTGRDPSSDRRRTPLTVAISRDDGASWENKRNLEDEAEGSYAYTAIFCHLDEVWLAYTCRDSRSAGVRLTRFPLDWLYQ